jgi:alpha-tubulin suppressor-like RCC1 family protein
MSSSHRTENSGGVFSWTGGNFVRANINNKVFTTVDSYQSNLYGVTKDGEVYHFGEVAPVKENVPTTEKIVDVAVGRGFVLYITETGKIFGKGDNSYGVLGIWEYADGPSRGQSIGENYISTGNQIVRCTHLEK